jgi:hypothetical protein
MEDPPISLLGFYMIQDLKDGCTLIIFEFYLHVKYYLCIYTTTKILHLGSHGHFDINRSWVTRKKKYVVAVRMRCGSEDGSEVEDDPIDPTWVYWLKGHLMDQRWRLSTFFQLSNPELVVRCSSDTTQVSFGYFEMRWNFKNPNQMFCSSSRS